MANLIDRRKLPRKQLAQLDRRTWRLWALNLAVTVSLAFGIAAFFYPAIKWRVATIEAHLFPVLPQLIVGLLILVLLQSVYIIARQRELNELRNFILATHAEAGLVEADYPQDPLTGVLDRRALPDVLKRETAWVDRYRVPLCLVLFDICKFSKINEKDGNLAGDLVLKDLAQALQATVRQTDSVLRYGPDQFLCLLPRTDLMGGEAFARRVGNACQSSGRLRNLIVNSGIAVYQAGTDPNEIVTNAERGLTARRAPTAIARGAAAQPT